MRWVLPRIPGDVRPVVVDNGSTDDSAAVAAALGATVVVETRRGFGAACQAGLEAAAGDIVAFMDADATLDPMQLDRVLEPLQADAADLVIGRRHGGSVTYPPHVRLANAVVLARLARRTGVRLHDLGPMRAASREALLSLGLADRRFGYPLEMVVAAAKHRWRIRETPVDYLPRIGKSKVTGTLSGTWHAVRDMNAVLAR